MDFRNKSRKDIGNWGEHVVCAYLVKNGFRVLGRNVPYKTGELDIVARKGGTFHIIEVKTLLCINFPRLNGDQYNPADNLSVSKLRKVIRTAEWHLSKIGWEGEWQVDGALVWLRARDGVARVRYLPQVG